MAAPRRGSFLMGFVHAFRGLGMLAATQRNFRVHLLATLAVLLAGWHFGVGATEWALLALCVFSVLAMEALNTAVEVLADRVCPEHDAMIGRAKDIAAAAVLLAAMGAALVGLIVFLPRL
ncbi:MAG: diacylglycerol kinase family protein [Thiobacillaceae bacterium]|jgi:diacylglycerol kinase|nr:diacylglycerol kinase family protein [Thiobacillaceae bacterium]